MSRTETMPHAPEAPERVVGTRLPTLEEAGWEVLSESRSPGLLRRLFATLRHLHGLLLGGLIAWVRNRPQHLRRGLRFRLLQLLALFLTPFVGSLRRESFPVQLRRRLELLGPTYIKLGQVLSLREDLLPPSVTEELKNLLNRLPAVPYERFLELVEEGLGRSPEELFSWIEPLPEGSASIAQSHRATTLDGEQVILKVVKPGIRSTLERDAFLLRLLSYFLELVIGRYQPRRLIREITEYTLREVDLEREANNCETFAANFADEPDIVFPRIYRQLSSRTVLCMEFLEGVRPDAEAAAELTPEARDRIIDLGMRAIVRMLYRDGFFHADLHPGNLLILPGPKAGFIDLGMVGRLDNDLRRTLLYYYYCLAAGDSQNASRYLMGVAEPGGDLDSYRREVEELSQRWQRGASFEEFSLARLILESTALGGRYRVYFPVELVLMSKALVTFEAVGHLMKPGFDVAEVSREHLYSVILDQFSPVRLARESLRGAPELVDALVKVPMLVTEGLRLVELTTKRNNENPFSGIRGTLFGGFCMLAGAISSAAGGPWPLWGSLFAVGLLAALVKGRA